MRGSDWLLLAAGGVGAVYLFDKVRSAFVAKNRAKNAAVVPTAMGIAAGEPHDGPESDGKPCCAGCSAGKGCGASSEGHWGRNDSGAVVWIGGIAPPLLGTGPSLPPSPVLVYTAPPPPPPHKVSVVWTPASRPTPRRVVKVVWAPPVTPRPLVHRR